MRAGNLPSGRCSAHWSFEWSSVAPNEITQSGRRCACGAGPLSAGVVGGGGGSGGIALGPVSKSRGPARRSNFVAHHHSLSSSCSSMLTCCVAVDSARQDSPVTYYQPRSGRKSINLADTPIITLSPRASLSPAALPPAASARLAKPSTSFAGPVGQQRNAPSSTKSRSEDAAAESADAESKKQQAAVTSIERLVDVLMAIQFVMVERQPTRRRETGDRERNSSRSVGRLGK